ncbi:MAG: serine/threonine-protein kinase [Myxococcota bacterium]
MEQTGELQAGTTFAGYRVLGLLGRGGMAEVYLARREDRGAQPAVIKRLRAELSNDAESRRMFLREAALARTFSHERIVKVLDLATGRGGHALIIEFVEGRNLKQVAIACQQRRRYPHSGVVARVLADVLAGLGYVHNLCGPDGRPLGLIHRDMSPENILITYGGEVKLVDFGIAKARHAAFGAGHTAAGILRGKARYVAPEGIDAKPLDARSDLFSVGVILYELLTLSRPFRGESDLEVLESVLEREPAPPRELNPKAPPELERICLKALEKEPSRRWQAAEEMRAALLAWLNGSGEGRAPDVGAFMNALFPPHTDPERVRLSELLSDDEEATLELDELTGTGMNTGLLSEALLDDVDG